MRAAGVLLLAAALPALAGKPELGTDAQRANGAKVYAKYCSQCHGDQGDGKGPAEPYLVPKPRDFTSGKYKIRSTPSGSLPTQQDLEHIIRQGMPYTAMPDWPKLTDDEVRDVVYHLKTFYADFANAEANVDPIEVPKAPAYSKESAEEGRKVYEGNGCLGCHGNLGRGDGASAKTLTDDWGHAIRAADLTARWTFRGGPTREDIFRRFSTGLNGTPMPSYFDSIKVEDRWKLVDYIVSLGGEGEENDTPRYADLVIAHRVADEIDPAQGAAAFAAATPARFPVVGQIMEPGRQTHPAATFVVVRAIYNEQDIAFLVTWHDRSAEKSGHNAPDLEVKVEDEIEAAPASPAEEDIFAEETAAPAQGGGDDFWGEESGTEGAAPGAEFSDAVALQLPSVLPTGIRKPYFLFGDAQAPVDLWFQDLAQGAPLRFTGKGSASITPAELEDLQSSATYQDGEWAVVFKRSLRSPSGVTFAPEQFVPVAFSVWDGFTRERGNHRGLTTWKSVYLEPAEGPPSPMRSVATTVLAALSIELLLVALVRRKANSRGAA
ncbi:MAG TPA: c-type cytochrome [Candidatus Polarisedimenticolaceae bacterium]|nr:c-type cytochrome [Candidatus Polarisedimenticolaceae bacterium]